GVLFLWCSLANTDGMKCARPSANRSLDEDMKNPWSPAKIPNDMASAGSAMPSPPMEVCTTEPVTHRAPPICSWSGEIHDVTRIIRTYVMIDASMPKTISLNVLSALNLNSSAAWGILSKPTYIQGAIATIRMIDVHMPLSLLNKGCAFPNENSPTKKDLTNRVATTAAMNMQKMNWIFPDRPLPLMLI